MELNLSTIFLNNSIKNYLFGLTALVTVFFLIKIFDRYLLNKMDIFIEKFSYSFSRFSKKLIKKRLYPFLYLLTFYIAFEQLTVKRQIDKFINFVLVTLTVVFIVLAISDIISYSLKKYWSKKEKSDEQQKILDITLFLVKFLLWTIALIFILDNLNIEITGLITGLGVGGVAIAFAAQSVLTDLFNYFTIFFDKPFDIGDFIITGEYRGTIESIGIKTTRIRSITGEQLIISNTDLVNSRINNYKRMQRRRINFSFGLTYDTPLNKLKKVPEIIEKIINSVDGTEFDRAHFAEFSNFSLIFQVVYYVNNSEYKTYMDIQEQINFKLKEKMTEIGAEFAFPSQTLYFNQKNNLESELRDLNQTD